MSPSSGSWGAVFTLPTVTVGVVCPAHSLSIRPPCQLKELHRTSSTWSIVSCQICVALDCPHSWQQEPLSSSSFSSSGEPAFLKSTCVLKPFIFSCTESLNIPACVLLFYLLQEQREFIHLLSLVMEELRRCLTVWLSRQRHGCCCL